MRLGETVEKQFSGTGHSSGKVLFFRVWGPSKPPFPHSMFALLFYFSGPNKCAWAKQCKNSFLEWGKPVAKVLFFVYGNFQTHNFYVRCSHYSFILEAPLNALWAK